MLNQNDVAKRQYRTAEKLNTRISIHDRYSVNPQGFGNWIVSHYRIAPGSAVLELGCGTGKMWTGQDQLIANCGKLVLSDFSEGMLAQAKETLRDQEDITYQVIDIQSIPYAENTFDAVIANMMLYHVPNIPKALAEVRRVLKDGGAFYCATYGENGMMTSLCGMFEKYGVKDQTNLAFTLQNGEGQLADFFFQVRRYDYVDALEVTDIEDMVNYIYSLSGMTALRQLPRATLRSVLQENAVNGVLHIPKEYGLFIAN